MADENKLSTKNDDQTIVEDNADIKQEDLAEDHDLELHISYDDPREVKQEHLSDCYSMLSDSVDDYVKIDTDVEIKDELVNNILRASTLGCGSTRIDDFKTGRKDVTKMTLEDPSDYSTPVSDSWNDYIKIETEVDINELDNNLPRASSSTLPALWTIPVLHQSNSVDWNILNNSDTNSDIEYISDECSEEETSNVHNNNILSESKRIRAMDYCYYCRQLVKSFARHIIRNHKYETEVTKILSKPVNSKERKDLIVILRKKGNFLINDDKYIKPVRKTNNNLDKTKQNILPCTYCLGYYSGKYLWRHTKFCSMNVDKSVSKKPQVDSQNYLVRSIPVDPKLRELVFPRMRPDTVSLVAKKDQLICEYGARYIKRGIEKNSINVISRKMRELAKLLIEIKKLQPNIKNLTNMLQPKYFNSIIEAVKIVGKFDQQKELYKSPTYVINVSSTLKQCCKIAILKENAKRKHKYSTEASEIETNLKTMISLLDTNCKLSISTKKLNSKPQNKVTMMSLTTDLKRLHEYINLRSISASVQLTQYNQDVSAFKDLLETVYCRLKLLSREHELQQILLDNFKSVYHNKPSNYDNFNTISLAEKILLKKCKRIVVREQHQEIPILLSTDVENDIKLLLKYRSNFVPKDNPYLFGKPYVNTPLCGFKVLTKYATQCGAKNPETISSSSLQNHVATISQVFHLSDSDIKELMSSIGHTMENQLADKFPEDVIHTAKMFKLLQLKEKGLANQYTGKSLDEIEVTLDDYILSDAEDDLDSDEHERTIYKKIDEGINYKKINQIKKKRIGVIKRVLERWTDEQKTLVRMYFQSHIEQKKAPKRTECELLKEQYPELFNNKSWEKIKVYVQNVYSKKVK